MSLLQSYPRRDVPRIASIHYMPNEVLGHIFQLGIYVGLKTGGRFATEVRGRILLVSRLWKEVGMSTPSLWTVVEFGPHIPLPLASAWISRAGALPLCITLYTYNPRNPALTPRLVADELSLIFNTIIPLSSRWLEFQFSGNDITLLSTVCQFLPTDLDVPLMQRFCINLIHDSLSVPAAFAHGFVIPLMSGPRPPCLVDVQLIRCAVHMPTLDLQGLRRLVLQDCSTSCTWQELQGLLRTLTLLEDLEIAGRSFQDPRPEDERHTIPLDTLLCLSFTDLTPDLAHALLRSLSMPILQKLTLHLHCALQINAFAFDSFVSGLVLGHLWTGLRELHLQALTCSLYDPPTSSIPELFHAFPDVETMALDFSESRLSTTFWRALFNEPQCVLPYLKTLTIAGLSLIAIQEFVWVRNSIQRPLQKLIIYTSSSELTVGRMSWLESNVTQVVFIEEL